MSPTRREFVTVLGAAALVGLTRKGAAEIPGGFVDDGGALGHRTVRDRAARVDVVSTPTRIVRTGVVIVGGGVAGLGAGWWLDKRGVREWTCLELDRVPGGTARSGHNDLGAFPWGAHYVPLPNAGALHVRELLRDVGVLQPDGTFDERARTFAPQERLWMHGAWHEGLEAPLLDRSHARYDWDRFRAAIARERASGGFTSPSTLGRPASHPLDAMTMAEWLEREGVRSPEVRWLVDYACRDDYGAHSSAISAWAGVHYWAAREHAGEEPLTWPGGNGWLVEQLAARAGARLQLGTPVHRIEAVRGGVHVYSGDTRYEARAAIVATPAFIARRLVANAPPGPDFVYSPWFVANLRLDRRPDTVGLASAWDSVIYDSPSLGFVDAGHQSLATVEGATTWTYYWALASDAPAQGRRRMSAEPFGAWRERVLADLEHAHPSVRRCVTRIDAVRHGHAMARPEPGFLSHPLRRSLLAARPPIVYANADTSGLPLFEETLEQAVRAAEATARVI
jgi:hypothetical protein